MELAFATISINCTIRDALRFLDERRIQFALVRDFESFSGIVTDGDIRRSLLAGKVLDTPISEVMNTSPKFLHRNHGLNRAEIISYMNGLKIRAIPVLDENRKLLSVYTLDELLGATELPLNALIMAGGKGERLKPLTDETPKPLIRVGNYRMIERTLYSFSAQNIKNVFIAVHHLKDKFFDALGDGSNYGVKISFIEEIKPLGTAGAISLIPNLESIDNLLVSNADLIHDIDFRAMYEFHESRNSDLTIASSMYPFRIPYGVLKHENLKLKSIDEKPTYEYPILCGVNILGRKALNMFETTSPIDMVAVIQTAINKKLSVNVFMSSAHWVDIGDPVILKREMSYFEESS
jgi:dTDP-glucose pyrophosphorylase